MSTCVIALGSNQGDSDDILHQACVELTSRGVRVSRISEFLRSRPVGKDAGAEFVNAAVQAETLLTPHETLKTLHEVEHLLGRRRVIHWGPRTLDLDLILFESQALNEPAITVPHPAMWYRHFVLKPAAEVAPEMVHPILGLTLQALYERICRRPLTIILPKDGGIQQAARQARSELLEEPWSGDSQPAIRLVEESAAAEPVFLQVVDGAVTPALFRVQVPDHLAPLEMQQWFRDLFLAMLP